MIFRGKLVYFNAVDFELIPEPFRVFWGDFVLDQRTGRSSDYKQFGDRFDPWDSTTASGPGLNRSIMGTDADETFQGNTGNCVINGGDGNDTIYGNGGVDFLMGGGGADTIYTGSTSFSRVRAGDGNDTIIGGDAIEWAHGNAGNDVLRMGKGNDKAYGGSGDDRLFGGSGMDWLQGGGGDDYVKGGFGADILKGGDGNDKLVDRYGRDWLDGQAGNDTLVSRSDQGRPEEAIDSVDKSSTDFDAWSDRLTGGSGADCFKFVYQMNATHDVAARNTDSSGRVNWMDIMRENESHHDHWVDWGGFDKIDDFNRAEGDHIKIAGHTVDVDELIFVDTNNDGYTESTMIYVISNQARMMANMMGMTEVQARMMTPMAHDQDFLGQILVQDARITMDDIALDFDSMASAFNFL